MSIEYKTGRNFQAKDLTDLFLSVNWGSGQYPEKLTEAMKNYETVISAWEGRKLIGLIAVMSDEVMNAYVPYLLVRPEYQRSGIGTRLLSIVKRRYEGFATITIVSYEEAAAFYRKCGFRDYHGTTVLHSSDLPD